MTTNQIPVVGIDPSLTSTGVCYDAEGPDAKVEILKTGLRGEKRLIWVRDQILGIVGGRVLAYGRPPLVILEGYSYASPNQAHQIGELGGVIRVALAEREIPFLVASPGIVKKFATGKGGAGKDLMVSSVTHRTGKIWASNDAVDSLVCYSIGRELLGREHPLGDLPKTHVDALKTLELPKGIRS